MASPLTPMPTELLTRILALVSVPAPNARPTASLPAIHLTCRAFHHLCLATDVDLQHVALRGRDEMRAFLHAIHARAAATTPDLETTTSSELGTDTAAGQGVAGEQKRRGVRVVGLFLDGNCPLDQAAHLRDAGLEDDYAHETTQLMLSILHALSPTHLRTLYLLYPSHVPSSSQSSPLPLPLVPTPFPFLHILHISTSSYTTSTDPSVPSYTLTDLSFPATPTLSLPRLRNFSLHGFRPSPSTLETLKQFPGAGLNIVPSAAELASVGFNLGKELERVCPGVEMIRWQGAFNQRKELFVPFAREWAVPSSSSSLSSSTMPTPPTIPANLHSITIMFPTHPPPLSTPLYRPHIFGITRNYMHIYLVYGKLGGDAIRSGRLDVEMEYGGGRIEALHSDFEGNNAENKDQDQDQGKDDEADANTNDNDEQEEIRYVGTPHPGRRADGKEITIPPLPFSSSSSSSSPPEDLEPGELPEPRKHLQILPHPHMELGVDMARDKVIEGGVLEREWSEFCGTGKGRRGWLLRI